MVKKLIMWMIVLVALSSMTYASLDNAVMYFSFDNDNISGTTIYDLSGNGRNGNNVGSVGTGDSGILGEAFNFSNSINDYVNLSFRPTGNPTDWTFNMWFKSDMPSEVLGGLYATGESAEAKDFSILLDTRAAQSSASILLSGFNMGTRFDVNASDWDDGNWHMITVYLPDGVEANSRVWLDNVELGINSAGTRTYNLGSTWGLIGFRKISDDFPFVGLIDEFGFWNESLVNNVSELYNSGAGFNPYNYVSTPVSSNFTVQANGTYGEGVLTTFNVTIVGDGFYSTSSSTITTGLLNNETGLYNITIEATGYESVEYNDYNVSNNLTGLLSALPLNNFTLITPNSSNTTSSLYTIDWTNAISPAGFNVTYNLTISYSNWTDIDEFQVNATSYIYNFSNYSIGTYWVSIDAYENYSGNWTTQSSQLTILPNSDYFYVYVYDYLGSSLLSSISVYDNYLSSSSTTNPYQSNIYNYLNLANYTSSRTVQLNITDLGYKHQKLAQNFTITKTSNNFSVNLTANKLVLDFYQSGVAYSTSGFIADTNKSVNWTNSSLVVVQQELVNGYVDVRFGSVDNENWTQYYEYVNTDYTHISEDLEVLSQADWVGYFRVLTRDGVPIKDATIRAEYSYPPLNNGSWVYHTLLGQRLTDGEGYDFFYFDSRTEVLLTITKDGYSAEQRLLTIGDEEFDGTKATALDIVMTESDTGSLANAWVVMPRTVINKTSDINGVIVAKGRDSVKFTTSYYQSIFGSSAYHDITSDCTALDECSFVIESGLDFTSANSDPIVVQFYLDGLNWNNYTINLDDDKKQNIWNIKALGLDDTYLRIVLYICLIMLVAGLGLAFRSSSITVSAFFIGCIVLALISDSFIWLGGVSIVMYIMRVLRKVVSE